MDFFTWDILGTMAGATFAVAILTEVTKGIPLISKLPTQVWSLILAFIVLIGAQAATGTGCHGHSDAGHWRPGSAERCAGKPGGKRRLRPSGSSQERPEDGLIKSAAIISGDAKSSRLRSLCAGSWTQTRLSI